jgi:hypothetical protein
MKHAAEFGSGAMIYIPSLIQIRLAFQKLIDGIHRHRDSVDMAKKFIFFFFFQNMNSWP